MPINQATLMRQCFIQGAIEHSKLVLIDRLKTFHLFDSLVQRMNLVLELSPATFIQKPHLQLYQWSIQLGNEFQPVFQFNYLILIKLLQFTKKQITLRVINNPSRPRFIISMVSTLLHHTAANILQASCCLSTTMFDLDILPHLAINNSGYRRISLRHEY